MLLTPGEAERPGAAMRLRYLPPTITLHQVELEKSIVADGSAQSRMFKPNTISLTGWEHDTQLDEAHWEVDDAGLYVKW
jgi:hypothetical protein